MSQSSAPLRVMLMNEYFYPDNQGGTGTATSDFVSRLRDDHGVEVTTIAGRFAYRDVNVTYPPFEEWKGTKIYRIVSPRWSREGATKRFLGNLVLAWSSLLKALVLPKPDVLFVTTSPMTLPIAARFMKTFRGVPYAYLIYDLDPDRTVALHVRKPDSPDVKLLRRWQKRWLNDADRVIAIGRCMKDYLVNTYEVPPENIAVVEVGADPNTVKRQESTDTSFRRRHGLDGFLVIYSGNFGQYHDFDTILDAAERLRDVRPDIHFVLTGGGPKRAYVEQQVENRKLTNVRLFPFVPEEEFSDMLASADMTVVTQETGMEGLCVPSKFYSFIAAGRPVLALMRKDAEVARVVDEAGIGLQIEIGDVDKLVEAMLGGAANAELADQQGRRAREVFDRLYTVDRVAEKMYTCLWECAKGEKRSFAPSSASVPTRATSDVEAEGEDSALAGAK